MAGPGDPNDVNVSEEGSYTDVRHGPPDDAGVLSRDAPVAEPPVAPDRPTRLQGRNTRAQMEGPDLRRSLRSAAEVEAARPRPPQDPLRVALLSMLLLVSLGAMGVLWLGRTPRSTADPPKPVPVEEIGGVPVRRGLQDVPKE